jgi:hypothetical protein
VLFGCTEFAVRALSEKVRSGCVHFERSRPLAGRAGCGAGPGVQTCAHGGKIQLYEQLNGEKKEKKNTLSCTGAPVLFEDLLSLSTRGQCDTFHKVMRISVFSITVLVTHCRDRGER